MKKFSLVFTNVKRQQMNKRELLEYLDLIPLDAPIIARVWNPLNSEPEICQVNVQIGKIDPVTSEIQESYTDGTSVLILEVQQSFSPSHKRGKRCHLCGQVIEKPAL